MNAVIMNVKIMANELSAHCTRDKNKLIDVSIIRNGMCVVHKGIEINFDLCGREN